MVKISAIRSLADICFQHVSYGICSVRDTMVVQLPHCITWRVIGKRTNKYSEESEVPPSGQSLRRNTVL